MGLVVLVALLAAAGLGWRVWRQAQTNRAAVIESVDGIDEAHFVRIGGVDQWITIRGLNRDNPVILSMQGEPGWASSAFIPSRLEKDFVVVQWDPRGAGKTYGRSGPIDSAFGLDRAAQDGLEVAHYARARLHRDKLILLGADWSAAAATLMARARPELFHALVTTGALVDTRRGDVQAYAQVLAKARARGDRVAQAALEAIGPPPYSGLAGLELGVQLARFYEAGAPDGLDLIAGVAAAPRYRLVDVWDWLNGYFSSQAHARDSAMSVDLFARPSDFAVPVFIFEGEDDDEAPAGLVRAYFDRLTAPRKTYISIARAGHDAAIARPDLFLSMLINRVRPLTAPAEGPVVLPADTTED